MSKIENVKSYAGKDLETIFFRPMLTGPDAQELGVRIMYNMPVPTRLHFWKRSGDILQKYASAGWVGGSSADRFQKTINLHKVKAEAGYSAEDYFNMVYELISARADVNLDDLSGTELEQAETELFRQAIAESIRVTMWLGDTTRSKLFNTFDGFLTRIQSDAAETGSEISSFTYTAKDDGETILKMLWEASSEELKGLRGDGQLVYLVTSDVYEAYEQVLDSAALESAYAAKQQGRSGLTYKGIPVVDVKLGSYLKQCTDMPQSFALLTDRRNMALAVNTGDFPGTEIRMWYNPDQMENRQRAVFMAGCDYLLPELITYSTRTETQAGNQTETQTETQTEGE